MFSCLVIDIYRILIMLNQQTVHACVFYDVFSFTVFDGFVSYSKKKKTLQKWREELFKDYSGQEITFSIFVFDGIQDIHMEHLESSKIIDLCSTAWVKVIEKLPKWSRNILWNIHHNIVFVLRVEQTWSRTPTQRPSGTRSGSRIHSHQFLTKWSKTLEGIKKF